MDTPKIESQKDFRQSGLQPRRRDFSGIAIAAALVAAVVVTLVILQPRPW